MDLLHVRTPVLVLVLLSLAVPNDNLFAETYGTTSRCVKHGSERMWSVNGQTFPERGGSGCYEVCWHCTWLLASVHAGRLGVGGGVFSRSVVLLFPKWWTDCQCPWCEHVL